MLFVYFTTEFSNSIYEIMATKSYPIYTRFNDVIDITNGNVIKEGRGLCWYPCRFIDNLLKSKRLVDILNTFYMIWN